MKTEITITIHGDSVTIEELNAEAVTVKISDYSWDDAIYDIGEAVKDYLEGLG